MVHLETGSNDGYLKKNRGSNFPNYYVLAEQTTTLLDAKDGSLLVTLGDTKSTSGIPVLFKSAAVLDVAGEYFW